MPRRKGYTTNACTNCAHAKRKCGWGSAEMCNRCKSRNEFCILNPTKKRGRKKSKIPQIQELNNTLPFNNYKLIESEGTHGTWYFFYSFTINY